jgi:tetratricopeptide (TPR) repeat protein
VDASGAQRWSNTFDRALDDIFAIQSEIADVVASTVVPQIVARRTTYQPKLDAYQNFLAGRELLRRRTRVRSDARSLLSKAVELDPRFAAAHAELAVTYLMGTPVREDLDRAEQAINTALRLEPGLPRAMAARGLLLTQQADPDSAEAEATLRSALEADPNMVDALNWLSGVVAAQGKEDEGLELQERAARIDPLNGAIALNVASSHMERGEIARAEQEILRLLELPDPGLYPYRGLADLYWQTGRLVDLHASEKRSALGHHWHYYGLAFVYALLGRWEQASYWTGRSATDWPHGVWAQFMPSFVPYWRGDYGQSLAEQDRAIAASGKTLAEMPPSVILGYGETQCMAGDYESAVRTLESVLDPAKPVRYGQFNIYERGVPHCLAWSYLKSGAKEKGRALLESLDHELQDRRREGVLHLSSDLYFFARNTLLLGEPDLALDRLDQAIEAGWRDYYIHVSDPRWASLRDHPRYRALMTKVKADVDRQAMEIARIDAEEDFPALLDRVRAAR